MRDQWPKTRKTIFVMAFVCAAASAARSEMTEPMEAVRQYVDAFNKGDVEAMAANCPNATSVLDGLAPHVWQGPTACRDWYRDVLGAGAREGASEYFITLDQPRHVDVTDDRAYVVVPATIDFQSAWEAGDAVRLYLHGSTSQDWRRMAHNCLGLDQRPLAATRMNVIGHATSP